MSDLAIYDMDRTITRFATYTPFLIHAARTRAPWRLAFAPAVIASMAAYGVRAIDRSRLKEINHRLLLGHMLEHTAIEPIVQSFADETLRTNIRPGAHRAIARDRSKGRRLVLATASYALYAEAIAERLGLDDVVATRSHRGADGHLLARIDGENCYGPAKMRMLSAWIAAEEIDRSQVQVRFYSDHASDAPVFEWADEPVAVSPHARLRRLAIARGWRIEDWSR